MAEQLVRQRSLLPIGEAGPIDGWVDDDLAAVATQLFSGSPGGLLVIDSRELIGSTARVVGTTMGELHFKAMMGLITLHVAAGMPEDGRCETTVGEFGRLIWGADRAQGGKNTRLLVKSILDLGSARFTVPGYDSVNQKAAKGMSNMSLLNDIFIDEAIMRSFDNEHREKIERSELGREFGGKRTGTIAWTMNANYVQRLAESELRRFDWVKAQQLRGVALSLWMVFSSPRVPYRPVLEDPDLEMVEVPLTPDACSALGVLAAQDAGRRRTLNHAGDSVCRADKSFVAFEAHGGRGRQSFLRIIRRKPAFSSMEPAYVAASDQMVLSS